jgi:hypothetical protein
MQYPAAAKLQFQNRILRFVDGAEQRYRGYGAPLRQWVVRLDLLDESELAALDEFFLTTQGQGGSFAFTDPRDNATYPNCSLADDQMTIELSGETRGATLLVIRENRS